jgi:hypothetical protein
LATLASCDGPPEFHLMHVFFFFHPRDYIGGEILLIKAFQKKWYLVGLPAADQDSRLLTGITYLLKS